jgi:two-component sensor histidine kinase
MKLVPAGVKLAPSGLRSPREGSGFSALLKYDPPMLSRRFTTQWGNWILFILGWAALSLLFAPEAYLSFYLRGQPIEWRETFELTVVNSAIAILFVPGIVWVTRRVPIERRNWRTVLLVHVPACLAFSLGHSGLYLIACYTHHEVGGTLFFRFHPNLLTYWAVVGFTQATDYFGKYRAHERQASQLRLQLLKAQLQPHFLFNTLHTISAMMHQDVKGADRMITRLSELLRMTLDHLGRNVVKLEEELEFLRVYLELERVRFGERLATRVDVSPDAKGALVPALFLQPLVENCIKHGLSIRQPDGLIEIRAMHEGHRLVLAVADNGSGLPPGVVRGRPLREGLGLSNTRNRLRQLYPEDYEFIVRARPGGGTEVMVDIPFQTARAATPDAVEPDEHEDPYADRRRRAMGAHEASVAPQL